MKRHMPKLLVILSMAFFLSFCSDPVKVGDKTNQITIVDSWISDVVDDDNDGYASQARLYIEITTEDPAVLYAVIRQRSASQYIFYKQTVAFDVDGSRILWIALGDDGFEVPLGCYDISVLIFNEADEEGNDVLAERSAENDVDLMDICMEYPEDDQPQVMLTFNNECPTEVFIDISGHGTITIPGQTADTYTFFGNPGVVVFNGETTIPVGGNLIWTNRSVDLTGLESYTYRLWYGDAIFYATITNSGGSALSDFYVNYQLNDEFYVDIFVPNDGIKRPLGYYNAHPETQIWVWSTGAQAWYFWSELNYPGGENQVISLTNSLPKAPGNITPSMHKMSETKLYIEAQ